MKATLAPDKEPRYNQLELTERERKLIEFIRELEFGSLTVEVQRGEPVIIRQPLKTVKL
jgi:hypothetical protein